MPCLCRQGMSSASYAVSTDIDVSKDRSAYTYSTKCNEKSFLSDYLMLKIKELLFRNVAKCVLVNRRYVFRVRQSTQRYLVLLDPEDGDVFFCENSILCITRRNILEGSYLQNVCCSVNADCVLRLTGSTTGGYLISYDSQKVRH
jgi:hypothetical protein